MHCCALPAGRSCAESLQQKSVAAVQKVETRLLPLASCSLGRQHEASSACADTGVLKLPF